MSGVKSRIIAVIEDDRAVLDSLKFSLEAQGFEACLFDCAEGAITSARIMSADCLVIDYTLPDGDGLTTLRTLRGRGLSCPAVIIASNPTARCRKEAVEAGAPLIEKPLIGDELEDLLRPILNVMAHTT